MKVSRAAAAVPAGYNFFEHMFTVHTAAELSSTVALCSRYRVARPRVCLGDRWTEALVDPATKHPRLPISVSAVTLGGHSDYWCGYRRYAAQAALDDVVRSDEPFGVAPIEAVASGQRRRHQLLPPHGVSADETWDVQFGVDFDEPLAAGHLPTPLRHLVFGSRFRPVLLPCRAHMARPWQLACDLGAAAAAVSYRSV